MSGLPFNPNPNSAGLPYQSQTQQNDKIIIPTKYATNPGSGSWTIISQYPAATSPGNLRTVTTVGVGTPDLVDMRSNRYRNTPQINPRYSGGVYRPNQLNNTYPANTIFGGLNRMNYVAGQNMTQVGQIRPITSSTMINMLTESNDFDLKNFCTCLQGNACDANLNPTSIDDEIPRWLLGLYQTTQFFIQEQFHSADFEDAQYAYKKQFNILDSNGKRLFVIKESQTQRTCFGSRAPVLTLAESTGANFIQIYLKSYACDVRSAFDSNLICSIEERATKCCSPATCYQVTNATGTPIYQFKHRSQNYYDFLVLGMDGRRIGKVGKTWIGLPHPNQSLAHSYGISFPIEISLQEKFYLLGAIVLLYYKNVKDMDRRERTRNGCECFCVCMLCAIVLFIFLALIYLGAHEMS